MRLIFIFLMVFSNLAVAREYISMAGSSAMYPFFILLSQGFKTAGLGHAPVVESTGTGAGLKAFCNGLSSNDPDVAMASRPISLGELGLCLKNNIQPPLELEFGFDAVVLLSGPQSPLRGLTLDILRLALGDFKPRIQSWNRIHSQLPDIPISFIGPASTSGSYETFADIILHKKNLNLRGDGIYQEVAGQETVVIQKLLVNPNRVGVMSFSFLKKAKHPLRVLSLNGIYPTPLSIQTGIYPLSRKLYVYVKRERLKSPQLRAFLEYMYSKDMMNPGGVLDTFGLVVLSPEHRLEQLIKLGGV